MSHSSHVKRLRDRAERCRELAEIMKTDKAPDDYLALARAYESLAETRAPLCETAAICIVTPR
jgi:hypothetical protein